MTALEFETAYAARSGVTVAWLHEHGRYAEPCSCGSPECEGWAMGAYCTCTDSGGLVAVVNGLCTYCGKPYRD